jgi:hypothetical protein
MNEGGAIEKEEGEGGGGKGEGTMGWKGEGVSIYSLFLGQFGFFLFEFFLLSLQLSQLFRVLF